MQLSIITLVFSDLTYGSKAIFLIFNINGAFSTIWRGTPIVFFNLAPAGKILFFYLIKLRSSNFIKTTFSF
ncbi:MAG: hypothetical protein APF83_05500 [Lutibacter sp. BRH_c52]|nr:MAG: hypothetical protein APF83_05500 [Lutibacter sp. BRH_c52]